MFRMNFGTKNKEFIKSATFLALPILAQDLVNTLVNLLDSVMIGSLNREAINAVGFSNQLFFLYSLLIFGVCSGSGVLIGQYWGRNDTKSIHRVMGIGFTIGSIAGLFFASVSIIFPRAFLSLYTTNETVIELGVGYLRTVGISYLLTPITMVINFALRNMKKGKFPMINIIAALLTNLLFNFLFIYVIKLGVVGAALGTVIARVTELFVQQLIIRKNKLPVLAKLKEYFGYNLKFFRNCMRITLPVILNEFMWAFGTMLYQVAYKPVGDDGQAAVQISSAIQNLFYIAGIALGASTGIMIANVLGEGDRAKAISYSRKGVTFNAVVGAAMTAIMLLTCPLFLRFYDVSPAVIHYANNILIITALSLEIRIFNYTAIVGILRSGGDTKFCLLLDCGAVWLVGVPLAFLGSYVFKLPIYLIVLLVTMEEVAKFIPGVIRVFNNKWANTVV